MMHIFTGTFCNIKRQYDFINLTQIHIIPPITPHMSSNKMSSDCYLPLLGATEIITVQLVPLSNSMLLSDIYSSQAY